MGVISKTEANQPQPGMIEKEVAAWELMKALGWTDLMSATVLRTIERDGDEIEPASPSHGHRTDRMLRTSSSQSTTSAAAIFDVLVRQQDRGRAQLARGA